MIVNAKIRRERQRGLEVNHGQLWVAYVIEAAIIGSAGYAGWQFANRYASDAIELWTMSITGTVAICFAELARIQLAKATRTQRGFWMRSLATIGVICMCLVTVKTMSQVTEQMFSPRLRQVQTTTNAVKVAEGDLAAIKAKRNSASAMLVPIAADVDKEQKNLDSLNKRIEEQGQAPKDREIKEWHHSKKKKGKKAKTWFTLRYEKVPWAGQQFADQIPQAQQKLADAIAKRDSANEEIAGLDEAIVKHKNKVSKAQADLREAVGESQLHSFTAMIFGKDPVQVTEGEVHWFLRFFVLLPAVMISIASTLLAITAYRRIEPSRPTRTSVDIDPSRTLERHIESVVNATIRHRELANDDNVLPSKPLAA